MGLRQELTALVREWSLLGGGERLPTIQERLRENYRAVQKRKAPPKQKKRSASRRGASVSELLKRYDACGNPRGINVRGNTLAPPRLVQCNFWFDHHQSGGSLPTE